MAELGAAGASAAPVPSDALLASFFGERRALAVRFAEHLTSSATERGLVGPREVPRIWDRHILNCAAVSELVPPSAHVADVGSGAGLPGVAVAIARPDVNVVLIEPLQRRVLWLEEIATDLGLTNVTVCRARAEELVGRFEFDVVTARAVAALPTLAGWCLPLVSPGGVVLAIKGRSAEEEVMAAGSRLRRLGVAEVGIRTCGVGLLDVPTTVVTLTRAAETVGSAGRRRSRSRTGDAGSGRRP